MAIDLSILLCTRNRCADLRPTLQSLVTAVEPFSGVEVIVVDNDSSDDTGKVVEEELKSLERGRTVVEKKLGLSNARNRALQESTGDLIVFVDDDVRMTSEWLTGILEAVESDADAVAGAVRLAPDLVRPWMLDRHRRMFAEASPDSSDALLLLTGANMAFRRAVLEKVPAFDPELGAGALGFCEETLFSRQLLEAGYKIRAAKNSFVVHHFQENRLARQSMMQSAYNQGRSFAYVDYHWSHDEKDLSPIDLAKMRIKSKLENSKSMPPEGATVKELDRSVCLGFHDQLQVERKRPRNYEKRGLKKIR